MPRNERAQEAISKFEAGDDREAFSAFAELYQDTQDEKEREMIFRILEEGYYQPNEEELRAAYQENCRVLASYPYQWGFQKCSLNSLPVQIFPVTESEYCVFDKREKRFSALREIRSGGMRDYLFQDLSHPVFRENDCNLYHLEYLNDNVRRSEDYGGDNHIYLYFDGLTELAPLLVFGELQALLEDRKFVFLVSAENRKRYPVDFKREFQTDYGAMRPQPIRVEEVKRICFWYKHAHSGTTLSRAVLGSLDEIQMLSGYSFNTESKRDGEELYFTQEFTDAVTDVSRLYTVSELENMQRSGRYEICLEGLSDYLEWLKQRRPAPHAYTVKELFCAYFLFHYEKRGLNPRIAPMLLYDPHMWDPSVYSKLVLSFPYRTVLTCMREPIMTFIRCQQIGIVGWNAFSTQYMLASEYIHTKFLHPELQPNYYGFRFEDLKTKPEIVSRALCRHLNIPYDPKMLDAEAPIDNAGFHNRGIDFSASLHWDLSACLSEFDRVRLEMFYEPIHRYYGYPAFSFEEHPLPETLVKELFRYSFRFENVNSRIYGKSAPPKEKLHSWVQEVLQNYWRKPFLSPKLIPLEENGTVAPSVV